VHELVIRGGTVVDGTGAPSFTADVGIDDGVIVSVGDEVGPGRRTVDADGLLVTPGFVDIHTHFDAQATWDPHLTPSCWHGVTTAVMGNCGVGFAPVRPGRHDWLIELMEGVEDIPGSALSEGIRCGWETFEEYMSALDAAPRAVNIGTQVPHAAVRAYVMEERAQGPATRADIDAMCQIVRGGLRAGALGFSTGRTAGHRDIHGEPVPGTFAAVDELSALFSVMSEEDRGVLQVVPAGSSGEVAGDAPGAMDAELEWMVACGERSRRPITFLVLESRRDPDGWRPWLDVVRNANRQGASIHPQVASRCFGMLLGHQSRLNPFRYHPTYRGLADLPFDDRIAALRDSSVRSRILGEQPDHAGEPPAVDQLGTRSFSNLFPLGEELDYEPGPEDSIAAIATRLGTDPWAVAYDLMLGSDGHDFLLFPLLNYGRGSYDGLHDMMSDPMTVQGLGDAGAHCGIICDASMTTFMLTHWARDRQRGPRLTIEEAVRRLTRGTANLYELYDRGAIAPGMRADLNLIDFGALRLMHPERVTDLPAEASRLIQRSTGYVETIVGGETIVSNGELTDAMPGRLVRGRQQPTSTH
jgi:N-acyl-D-amino-acid deacylase